MGDIIRRPRCHAAPLTSAAVAVGLAMLLVAVAASPGLAAGGDLDPSFGDGGKVLTDFGGQDEADAALVLPSGKIVVVGGGSAPPTAGFFLARYKANGDLDPTFGIGGLVRTTDEGLIVATDAALIRDGRIVAVGFAFGDSGPIFALARYMPDGGPDPTFGGNGIVTTPITGDLRSVAIQHWNDRILVAGTIVSEQTGFFEFVVARYRVDGSLDDGFGNGGLVVRSLGPFDDTAQDVAVAARGRIVAAGQTCTTASFAPCDFAVVMLTSDGSPVESFGDGGTVITEVSPDDDAASAVAVLPSDAILVTGSAVAENYDFAAARYRPNGSLDPTFGDNGLVTTDFGGQDFGDNLHLLPRGRFVIGGIAGLASQDFALARYNPNGSLDPSFGGDGKVTTDFAGRNDLCFGIDVQDNGRIVAVGRTFNGTDRDFAVARYLR